MTPPSPRAPVHSPAVEAAWKQPTIVGAAALAIYALTAAREPQFGDGMELVASAAVLGVPHPTGYPLLTMLSWPLAHGAGAYFRVTMLCALFVAGAAALLCTALRRYLHEAEPQGDAVRWRAWFPAFAALLFVWSASAWSAATLVEVYALNTLLLLGIVAGLTPSPGTPGSARWLLVASLLQGLALCNHLSSLCMAPLLAVRAVQHLRLAAPPVRIKLLASGPLLFLAGLLPWLYVPIRSAASPPINWGGGHTWEGFVWLIRGGDYGRMQLLQQMPGRSFTLETWLPFAVERIGLMLQVLGGEALGGATRLPGFLALLIGVVVLGLAILGWVLLWRRDRILAGGLALATFLQILFVLLYNIPDIEDYFLGIWATGFLPLALGLWVVLNKGAAAFGYEADPNKQSRMLAFYAVALLVVVFSNWPVADRSNETIGRVWIERLLEALPENAVLLAHGDYDTYPMWYAQHVEGRRPDVFLVSANFLRNAWYADMIPADDPLGRTASPEPADVLAERLTVEDHVAMLAERVIEPNLTRAPLFTTTDPLSGLRPHLGARYRLQPTAVLLTEEEMLGMLDRHPTYAPPLLERFEPPQQ